MPEPIVAQPEGTGEETPAESPAENKPAEHTPSDGGDINTQTDLEEKKIPFHEDPQVQDYIGRQVESRAAKIKEELAADFEKRYGPQTPPQNEDTKVEVPEWWGGDEKQWSTFQQFLQQRDEKVSEAAYNRFVKQQSDDQKAINDANVWFTDNVKEIESNKELNPNGMKLDRKTQELILDTVIKNELIDSKGRWNYKAAWKIVAPTLGTPKPKVDDANREQRKNLANATTSNDGGKGGSEDTAAIGSEHFKSPQNRPW